MAKRTRLGNWGHNTRRDGSFSGKTVNINHHPVGLITRLGSWGHNTRRIVSFAGKTDNTTPGVSGSEWIIQQRMRFIR